MKLTSFASLILFVVSASANGQISTLELSARASSIKSKLESTQNNMYRLSLGLPTATSCETVGNDLEANYKLLSQLSDDVKVGLTYEADRGFLRLDVYSSSVKMTTVMSNLYAARKYLCSTSAIGKDFAEIYLELAKTNLELAGVYLDRARK